MDTEMNTTPGQTDLSTVLTIEDKLDLQLSPVEMNTAKTEINACNDYLVINNRNINFQIAEVPKAELAFLQDKAMAMLAGYTGNFITGLKLNLAINNDLMVLVYQPVVMKRPPSTLSEPVYTISEGDFYTYDTATKKMVSITGTDADVLTSNYQTKIGIRHRGENTFNSFVPNVDTEAAIFPFQTINLLMKENKTSSVFIFNSIRKEDVGASYSIKHCLLLSYQILQTNVFEGKMANRSHLCPPSCNSLQYAIVKS